MTDSDEAAAPAARGEAGQVRTAPGRFGGRGRAVFRTAAPFLWLFALLIAAGAQILLIVRREYSAGIAAYGLAAGCLALALAGQPVAGCRARPATQRRPGRPGTMPIVAAVAGACLALAVAAILVFQLWLPAAALWLLALIAASLAALPPNVLRSPTGTLRPVRHMRRHAEEILLVGVVAAAAFVLRIIDLAGLPAGLHRDEAVFGMAAREVLAGRGPSPFGVVLNDDPALFVYLTAPFVWLAGPNAVGLRYLAVLAGTATVAAFYLFLRVLFGRGAALFGAILVAVSGVFINFSRLALNVPESTLFLCLSLLCLYLAIQRDGTRWWLWSGILAGLGLYFHFSSRLFYLIAAFLLIYVIVLKRLSPRDSLKGVALIGAGSLAAYAPFLATLFSGGRSLVQHEIDRFIFSNWERVTATYPGLGAPEIVWRQLEITLLAYVWTADQGQFTFTDAPLLSPLIVPLAILGFVLILLRSRETRFALLLSWIGVVTIASALTIDIPQSHRLLPAVLPLLGGASLILAVTVRFARRLGGRGTAGATTAAVIGLFVVVGIGDFQTLFGPNSRPRMWEVQAVMADYVAAHPDARYAVMGAIHSYFGHDSRRFLAPDAEGVDLLNPGIEAPRAVPDDKDLVYLVYDNWAEYLPLLRALHPTAQSEVVVGRGGRTVLTAVWVPRSDLAAFQGLRGEAAGASPWVDRDTRALTIAPGAAGTIRWSGSFFVPALGAYAFEASGDDAALRIDGLDHGRSVRLELRAGWHDLEFTANAATAGEAVGLVWQPPNEEYASIPRHLLDRRRLVPLRGGTPAEGGVPIGPAGSFGLRDLAKIRQVSAPVPVRWQGILRVEQSGEYLLALCAGGAAEVAIDGQTVATRPAGQPVDQLTEFRLHLSPGPHPLEVRYDWQSESGRLELYWTPPGELRRIIPPENFGPPS